MWRLLLFGLAVGLMELLADAWLVDHTRTRDYSIGGGPMIWRSPMWMRLAWEVGGSAIRLYRSALIEALWPRRSANSCAAWSYQHSFL